VAVARDQALSAYFRRPQLLRRLTRGHVNDSWLVAQDDRRFVVQRINRVAFKDLHVVARNFDKRIGPVAIARRTHREGAGDRGGPAVVLRRFRRPLAPYAYRRRSCGQSRSASAARDAAHAFGAFARALSALDASLFAAGDSSVPRLRHRVRQFERAVATDRAGHAKSSARDIERVRGLVTAVRSHRRIRHVETTACAGRAQRREAANLVRRAHERPCVIDLDTIGPGRLGYDLGELVRSVIPEHDTGAPLDVAMIERVWDRLRRRMASSARPGRARVGPDRRAWCSPSNWRAGNLASHLAGDRYLRRRRAHGPARTRARVQMRRPHCSST
jgi:hypothetical protein